MPFINSMVAGNGTLVRARIKSPNYVTGVSGWTVNKDGSAEFNNITVRGAIDITDASGARIFADPATTAAFSFYPPRSWHYPTRTWNPGTIGAFAHGNFNPLPEWPELFIDAPSQVGVSGSCNITMNGVSSDSPSSKIQVVSDVLTVIGNAQGCNYNHSGDITVNSAGTSSTGIPVQLTAAYVSATTPSAGFTTTETLTDTVTFTEVAGKIYRVTWSVPIQSSVSGDTILYRLRQDNLAGTSLGSSRDTLPVGTIDTRFVFVGYYTGVSTGFSKTIVGSILRTAGTGTITRSGAVAQPSTLEVVQIS